MDLNLLQVQFRSASSVASITIGMHGRPISQNTVGRYLREAHFGTRITMCDFCAVDLTNVPPCAPEEVNIYSLVARVSALEKEAARSASNVASLQTKVVRRCHPKKPCFSSPRTSFKTSRITIFHIFFFRKKKLKIQNSSTTSIHHFAMQRFLSIISSLQPFSTFDGAFWDKTKGLQTLEEAVNLTIIIFGLVISSDNYSLFICKIWVN